MSVGWTRPLKRRIQVGPQLQISYVDPAGQELITTPAQAAAIAFERCRPARAIPSYVGQGHTPGRYWAATSGELIGYESYLESQWLTLLDFDPAVVALREQPLRFEGVDAHGAWKHTPDFFARLADGNARVVDVKNPRHRDRDDVQMQARRSADACAKIGWEYRMVFDPDPQQWANVSWLAGFRRSPYAGAELTEQILNLARRPVRLGDLLSFLKNPEMARPIVFHLCWRQLLTFDLHQPLSESTVVRLADTVGKEPL